MSQNNPTLYIDRYSKAYVAGLNSSRGYVLKDGDNIIVFVDNRYYQRMIKESENNPNINVVLVNDDLIDVISYLQNKNYPGLNLDFKTIDYSKALLLLNNGIKLHDQSQTRLRLVKSKAELKQIEELAILTEQVFLKFQSQIKLGLSEKQLAAILRELLVESGFDSESFPIIVAYGENSSMPHHNPTDKRLENNTNILIDFGGKLGNYNTDLTRNLFIGTPSDEYRLLYKKVYDCQRHVIAGEYKLINELQAKARSEFAKTDDNKYYLHNLGHGVGYEVHEYPDLNTEDNDQLANDMIITIEPGLYIADKFGVRIEDMVVVNEGKIKPLTKSPEEIICLNLT